MNTIPTLDEFIEEWWAKHPRLAETELGQNGQFDELPYAEYERLYGNEQECTTQTEGAKESLPPERV